MQQAVLPARTARNDCGVPRRNYPAVDTFNADVVPLCAAYRLIGALI